MLGKLETRLRGYASWVPDDWRIVVIVDRDNEDCRNLKARLEDLAARAGLRTRTKSGHPQWRLVNRIAIDELESWYFGDWKAVQAAYPRVPDIIRCKGFCTHDVTSGGTWEAFERVMRKHGYFKGGLAKIEAARTIGFHVDPERNCSESFKAFWIAISEAIA